MIAALQAVVNYPESRSFVETVSCTLPGLQTLLDTPVQPAGCVLTTNQCQGFSMMAPRPLSHVSDEADEELGRKRPTSPEVATSTNQNYSSTIHPPPDKHRQGDANPISRVIHEPPKVIHGRGIGDVSSTPSLCAHRHGLHI